MKRIFFIYADMIDLSKIFRRRALMRFKPQIPVGIFFVLTYLKNMGYEVYFLNNYIMHVNDEWIMYKIKEFKPDIVMFSINCLNEQNSISISRKVRKIFPKMRIIIGGPQTRFICHNDFLANVKVIGEGDNLPKEIIEEFQGAYSANRVLKLPIHYDYSLIDSQYHTKSTNLKGLNKVISISTSRGCPYDCAFCSSSEIWRRKYITMPAESVIISIQKAIESCNADGIYFREDNFTVDRKRVIDICKLMIEKKINIVWQCESRINQIDEELLNIMYEAGCQSIWFGIESGNDKTLTYIRKNYNRDKILEKWDLIKKTKIKTGAGFIFGFRKQTAEEVLDDLKFAKDLQADWTYFQAFVGFPISDIYRDFLGDQNLYVVNKFYDVYTFETEYISDLDIFEMEEKAENELKTV